MVLSSPEDAFQKISTRSSVFAKRNDMSRSQIAPFASRLIALPMKTEGLVLYSGSIKRNLMHRLNSDRSGPGNARNISLGQVFCADYSGLPATSNGTKP
jgi:hypothetical protein